MATKYAVVNLGYQFLQQYACVCAVMLLYSVIGIVPSPSVKTFQDFGGCTIHHKHSMSSFNRD